ncbi:transmembrane protein 201 [Megalops cyprinoides]|uniref:transmembrane protein 201 n=1 Tax=Megalops cyprinoides TaxID=118141 RepID=UPI00186563F1|nr:transmembrane protein 201 [Megalops cyprinoides]
MEFFNQMLTEYPHATYGGVGATACAAGALVYKVATRKKPTHVNVNCWFCNQDTVVPYGNRNCWDCPNCEQYNGFQENGDYNKPIPAQYMEHLNHGVSAGLPHPEATKTLQWVNCQMLLCKKCNNNQTLKIKQLASFVPREDEKYDEEIEVFKHHLEQTHKLCRPCQTAVEYYIKHQNRQLRALLFNHQLKRSRDGNTAFIQSPYTSTTPGWVIFLRVLAFLTCAFLLAVALYGPGEPLASSSPPQTQSGGVSVPKPTPGHGPVNGSTEDRRAWPQLLGLLPDEALENVRLLWNCGRDHQVAVVSLGLFTCVTSIFLAGPIRLRRIDAAASILWFAVMGLHLAECYLKQDAPSWLDTVKLSATCLCCLAGFAAAAASHATTGQRRARGHRSLPPSSPGSCYSGQGPLISPPLSSASAFVPSPPPNLSRLLDWRTGQRACRCSPSSLPGRLNRALSLGTSPSFTRTDSGYLFSGSRPSSQCKDSPSSGYFSQRCGSRPTSPGPSPTPSVAGSVTSTSSSARQRRPLISPARLKLGGQRLQLFSHPEPIHLAPPPCPSEHSPFPSGPYQPEVLPYRPHNHDLRSLLDDGIAFGGAEEKRKEKEGSSSSAACLVDTTTGEGAGGRTGWKGLVGRFLWPALLCASLSGNLVFTSLYLYHTWR